MILESKWLLSGVIGAGGAVTGQALTGTSAVISTNSVDVGTLYGGAPDQPGYNQDDLYLVVTAKVASGGTTPTLAISVQSATDAAFTSPNTLSTRNVGALRAGEVVGIHLPQTNDRYIRLSYTQAGTSPTNTVVAGLTTKPQNWKSFPNAI